MHQDEVLFAEDFYGVIDFGVGAHAGGGDDGLPGFADVLEEVVVGEGSGGDFVDGWIEDFDEVYGLLVPGGDEPVDLYLLAEGGDFGVVLFAEFEAALEVTVG